MTVVISTPSEFLNAVKKENITWPVKYDDGMPYAGGRNEYWSAYFSTKPSLKKQVRDAEGYLGAFDKLASLEVLKNTTTQSEINMIME